MYGWNCYHETVIFLVFCCMNTCGKWIINKELINGIGQQFKSFIFKVSFVMELFVLFSRSVYKLGFPQGARVWQSNQLEKLLILLTEIIDHAFFFLLFTNLLPEWLTCDFSMQFQTVHRSSQEIKMQHMEIFSRNTDVPIYSDAFLYYIHICIFFVLFFL